MTRPAPSRTRRTAIRSLTLKTCGDRAGDELVGVAVTMEIRSPWARCCSTSSSAWGLHGRVDHLLAGLLQCLLGGFVHLAPHAGGEADVVSQHQGAFAVLLVEAVVGLAVGVAVGQALADQEFAELVVGGRAAAACGQGRTGTGSWGLRSQHLFQQGDRQHAMLGQGIAVQSGPAGS